MITNLKVQIEEDKIIEEALKEQQKEETRSLEIQKKKLSH
jgi:hypothetical protein